MLGDSLVVTGAAGSIGSAVVRTALDAGSHVLAVDKTLLADDGLSSEGLTRIQADLTNADDLAGLIRELEEWPPPGHVLLVHGGASESEVHADSLQLNDETFRDALEMNLVSAYSTIRELAPILARSDNRARSFLLVSSINAFSAFGYPAYSAAKAGVESLVKSLSRPLAAMSVRINAVALGTVVDPAGSTLHGNESGHFDRMRAQSLLDRVMSPEDAADVILCVSRQLVPVTGQVVVADYGQSIPRLQDRSAP